MDAPPTPAIVMTPPTHPTASSSHPRRAPANRSVSLRHPHPPQSRKSPKESDTSSSREGKELSSTTTTDAHGSDGNLSSAKNSDGSPSSLQPLGGRDSSGESSNADRWFEKSNNDVQDASFADNDPPFFMRHSSSSLTPPEQQQQMRQLLGPTDASGALPLRTGLLRLGTDGSSTEEYRSVIDDLTVENKNLKRRLKKYEKLHDSHLKDEKLFEVRIHGLPAHKKRELEDTLRNFASGLSPTAFPAPHYEAILPNLTGKKTTSSQASLQNTDSAYASMSASGQGSSARGATDAQRRPVGSSTAQRKQTIHSYLHHIPEGLLPQPNPANMTERAKKKLVVRRLEQVFAGKGAIGGAHHHPMQQQEVSQSAARADKVAEDAQDVQQSREGHREAQMLAWSASASAPTTDQHGSDQTSQQRLPFREPEGSDQRPTRPLDLDPDRAQVPAENIKYMRHLGFSPPDPEIAHSPEEGHGWVYLNLLVNLAQLHTINVTPDYVRKALGEYSSKFEISPDGRKVRWRGGRSVTRGSSSGGRSSCTPAGVNTPDAGSPRKRPKLVHRTSNQSATTTRPGASSHHKLVYTPLFFHKDSTDEDRCSSGDEEEGSSSSPFPFPMAGNSSGMTSSGQHTVVLINKKRKKREDGPIIFYNNARFCTDLSGDYNANGNMNAPPYTTTNTRPIGLKQFLPEGGVMEKRGPLAQAFELPEPMDLSDNPIPESLELSFPRKTLSSSSRSSEMTPIDLSVTGIGGVWPADHFTITVDRRYAPMDQESGRVPDQAPSTLPPPLARILRESGRPRQPRVAVRNTVVATSVQDLPPSELPAALSYMPFSEDSNEDDASEQDDDFSLSPDLHGDFPPATAPQPVAIPYAISEDHEDDEYDDSSDVDSDTSLDLLAAARILDPEAIREQERQYDAQCAERLAEEIPTGSSAATAGGGSGFNSPASNVDGAEHKRARRKARVKQASRQHQPTTVNSKMRDSHGEDEEEEEDQGDVEMSIAS